ncbi:MAG: peptidase MA family metallohydrolase [Chloroflexota bacterium]
MLRVSRSGLLLILIFISVGAASAQAEVNFGEVSASHIFSEQLSFQAEITTNQPITNLELVFQPQGRSSIVLPVSVSDGNHLTVVYQINQQDSFAPFIEISYWFIAHMENGGQVESGIYTYQYSDNRYTWQTLDSPENYRVFWVEGDPAFGQAVLDAVDSSYDRFEQYLSLPIPDSLDIFVYPSSNAMQTALETSGINWASGHADPALGHVFTVISGEYDERFETESTIPHEVTHIRLYLRLGENYANLPAWLNEGISLLSERIQSTDWSQVVRAQQDHRLFAFSQLCNAFPRTGSEAAVAYAQSESLVRYIFQEYGKIGLESLIEAYNQGYACEQGVQVSLGISLTALETNWHKAHFNQAPPTVESEGLIGLAIIAVVVSLPALLMIAIDTRRRRKREAKIIAGNK